MKLDIFNRKRIEELERDLRNERDKNHRLNNELGALKSSFNQAIDLSASVPEDCTKGPWCKACAFVKTFNCVNDYGYDLLGTHTIYVCGKGETCQHFIQKEIEE